jgi:hypothetical protein
LVKAKAEGLKLDLEFRKKPEGGWIMDKPGVTLDFGPKYKLESDRVSLKSHSWDWISAKRKDFLHSIEK